MPGGRDGIRFGCLRPAVTTDCRGCRFRDRPPRIRPRTRPPTISRLMPASSNSLSEPESKSTDGPKPGIDSRWVVGASTRYSRRTSSWRPARSTRRGFRHSHASWMRASSSSTPRSTATHLKFRKEPCSSWAPGTPERRSRSSSLPITRHGYPARTRDRNPPAPEVVSITSSRPSCGS